MQITIRRRDRWGLLAIACLLAIAAPGLAQESPPASAPAEPPAAAGGVDDASLALSQEQVVAKFKRFEEVLLRMSELTAATDPKRAALLRKAVTQSKEELIGLQLERLVELLHEDRLANAVTNQQAVDEDLAKLLELLLTEQRGERLKGEKERIKEQIRRIKELINKQQQLQGQTASGADAESLARGQEKLSEETGKLAGEMKPGDGKPDEGKQGESKPNDGKPEDPKPGEGKPGEGKPGEGKPGEGKPGEGKPGEGKPGEGKPVEGKPGEGKPGEGNPDEAKPDEGKPEDTKPGESKPGEGKPGEGKPEEGKPGEGESGEGESGESQPSEEQQENPAQQRVKAAQEKMEQAKQKLEKAQREGAIPDQEEAIRELEKAKAELEEILRQMREEELQRTLAMLEARFRKMLQMQIDVYEATKRLDRVASTDRGRNDEIESGRQSRKESLIVVEVDSALAVFRDEGSAVAFPEAVQQMREDMELVVARLAQAKVDEVTQGYEEDIIAALEEMIEALQKAQQDAEKKKQQPSQPSEPQDPPLVDTLAELKMIRALQMRVNLRTRRFGKLVEGDLGQAEKSELLEALEQLGDREQRIYRATRDIVVGKNQ